MKRDEIIALGLAEYKRIALAEKARKADPWQQTLEKIYAPGRRFRSRLRGIFWRLKSHAKHHYHLHLALKNEENHWRADTYFRSQVRREKEPKQVEGLFDTLFRRLAPLRKEMEAAPPEEPSALRKFRGRFAKTVREHRGLSRKQLCRLLNSHKDLPIHGRRHPSYWNEFPFTPAFIEKFEEQTATMFEEVTQGFLFGAGFPTEDFARWLSEIYCAEEDFERFKEWYANLKRTEV